MWRGGRFCVLGFGGWVLEFESRRASTARHPTSRSSSPARAPTDRPGPGMRDGSGRR
jgi:hypothetical protein